VNPRKHSFAPLRNGWISVKASKALMMLGTPSRITLPSALMVTSSTKPSTLSEEDAASTKTHQGHPTKE
jgi:hypothetical protein